MKAIGLTGGIGMGKSAAADIFSRRGIPVADSDVLARDVVGPGQPALDEIRATFGNGVINPDGSLRREALARIVFNDPAARKQLEAITHPRIRAGWLAALERWRNEGRAAAVVAIPLLFETVAEKHFDVTLCVGCSPRTQRERLRRRGWSDDVIDGRIAAQLGIESKMSRATFGIWNDGTLEVLESQIARILDGGAPASRRHGS